MARSFLMAVVGLLAAAGCVGPPELAVETPLFVFNSYPTGGATIAKADLRELAVTFSSDLGPAEEVREAAGSTVALVGEAGPLPVVRDDGTNVAYDDETFTLRVLLDPEVRGELRPGPWQLVVRRGLDAADGRVLPTDFVARFIVAE